MEIAIVIAKGPLFSPISTMLKLQFIVNNKFKHTYKLNHYLINENTHKSFRIANKVLNLLKHFHHQLTTLLNNI